MQHLDEGTIHAWLDEALTPEEGAAVERHVASCTECAALVAEARGLIAASSRILAALDVVPSGVLPEPAFVEPGVVPLGSASRQRKRWWQSARFAAAAGITFLAASSLFVLNRAGQDVSLSESPDAAVPAMVPERTTASPAQSGADSLGAQAPIADEARRLAAPPRPQPSAAEQERPQERATALSRVAAQDQPRAAAPPPAAPVPDAAGFAKKELAAADSVAVPPAPIVATSRAQDARRERSETKARADQTATLADTAVTRRPVGARVADASTFVRGRITDRATGAPISAAHVIVGATQRGALTDQDGRFVVRDVPSGLHELRVQRIGYSLASSRLDVTPGESLFVALSLDAAPLSLQSVVTTATGASQPTRAAGNAVVGVAARAPRTDSTRVLESVRGNASLSVPAADAFIGCYRLEPLAVDDARGQQSALFSLRGVVRLDSTAIAERGVFAGYRLEVEGGGRIGDIARWRVVGDRLLSLERADGVVVAVAVPDPVGEAALARTSAQLNTSPYAGTPRVRATSTECPRR